MAASVDDMFSFCVDPGKVAACVEVRFIDNKKVRWFRDRQIKQIYTDLWLHVAPGIEAPGSVDQSQAEQRLLGSESTEGTGLVYE